MGRVHNSMNGFCSGQAGGTMNHSNHATSANLTVGLSLRVVGIASGAVPVLGKWRRSSSTRSRRSGGLYQCKRSHCGIGTALFLEDATNERIRDGSAQNQGLLGFERVVRGTPRRSRQSKFDCDDAVSHLTNEGVMGFEQSPVTSTSKQTYNRV